ncbi:type III-A CRISPR-associated protein Cas10/Csm1 [Candidatus Poribacteria bacterium]|nr:type III-A CRISPR-associated protein Cas10/Csm1 [Candidatus Poribacteria bacterium]
MTKGQNTLKEKDHLPLAALLHDIGKFRQRAIDRYKPHQEHSFEFVNSDFAEFFSPCGDIFENAILHHHPERHLGCSPHQLEHLIEKQVILADRLSVTEREDEEREAEDFVKSTLISPLSRLLGADKDKEFCYKLTTLNFNRDTIIPSETAEVDETDYANLWKEFLGEFRKATDGKTYEPRYYQTIVALLHKYTSRMPSATSWGVRDEKTVPDISLYDHLRTTAAIAACIGRELSETEVDEELKILADKKEDKKESARNICALIKGDISGIQNFLYHIQSDGASNQLRGRSFYLQLLTEAIANWVLKQFDLPITNLLLASGGHFYILAPYTKAKDELDTLRQRISQKLWKLHRGDISCILADISIKARDFKAENFSNKWREVSEKIQQRKQQKWSEMDAQQMFENLFDPDQNSAVGDSDENEKDYWKFDELGKQLRNATYMIAFEVADESTNSEELTWNDAIITFGLDIHICEDTNERPESEHAKHAIVYRFAETDFLTGIEKYQWDGISESYDFRIFKPVIARRHDTEDLEKIADYNYLAEASEGVHWLGALRMDVDNLGTVFKEKLKNATISRHATLSRELRLFFEGYVPQLCKEHNKSSKKEILELIYAGGDDLFLVGGWSALPEIAQKIRSEFHHFVTGNHVTLSGGIAIEHMKFPLYQFAERSGNAETAAKSLDKKNAITFLQQPMKWKEFAEVNEWHDKFVDALTGQPQLPRDILTRLGQIYKDEKRWAWRSLYYFHRLQERYKSDEQRNFLRDLKQELNHQDSAQFREELIHVITRWTALRIRKS